MNIRKRSARVFAVVTLLAAIGLALLIGPPTPMEADPASPDCIPIPDCGCLTSTQTCQTTYSKDYIQSGDCPENTWRWISYQHDLNDYEYGVRQGGQTGWFLTSCVASPHPLSWQQCRYTC